MLPMTNPFQEIIDRLNGLEAKIISSNDSPNSPKPEIIDRDELCKRLNITEPTVIRWEKKGVIPSMRIGISVRYNWPTVIESLENKKPR